MSYYAIIKYVPNDSNSPEVIHRIKQPDYGEKGFYVEALKAEFYRTGKRRNATKAEKETHRAGCVWAPWGMYYTHNWREEEWFKDCENKKQSFAKYNMDYDERNLQVINHDCIDDFFDFVGFDRKKRCYARKNSPYI